MFEAHFQVDGITDLMFGQPVKTPKSDNETHEQHEERTWQEKVPITPDGHIYMNPFAVTNSLVAAGAWLKRKVPGEQRATFTKRFQSGVGPGNKVLIFRADGKPATMKDIDPIHLFVPSDGKHGGSKRVVRIFPTLHKWKATGNIFVFDGKISIDVLRDHFECAGQYIGWGSMRVGNGGINGRFRVVELTVHELKQTA